VTGASAAGGDPDDRRVVRPVTTTEFPAFTACVGTAFGRHLGGPWEERIRVDIGDRAVGTFEGERLVGTSGWFPVELTAPGGRPLPAAYVVAMAVLPTHRRRGLMAAMLRRQLDDIRAAGLPVAMLTASEGGIYARFGYGPATSRCHYELDKDVVRLAVAPAAPGAVRLIEPSEAAEVAPVLWDRARRARVGEVSLPPSFWPGHFEKDADGAAEQRRRFFVVYEVDGTVEGWADYQVVPDEPGARRTAVEVELLVTVSREAYGALMAYLLGIDLASVLRLHHRELDEPLGQLLTDPRQLRIVKCDDDVWLRPIDVREALAARRYPDIGPASLSILVHDALCGWNEGRYVLEVDGAGEATVVGPGPPGVGADLELGVGELGSVLLGGHRWTSLVRAGRLAEHRPGAAWRADALFAAEDAPFSTISL
jgi:predicted acetyltransferase